MFKVFYLGNLIMILISLRLRPSNFLREICIELWSIFNICNTVGRWVAGTIAPPSYGPMFILIDWEKFRETMGS